MSERLPSDYVDHFAERLRSIGGAPVVVGALAAIRYRDRPRFTTDADILVAPLDGISELFAADGYTVRTRVQPGESVPYIYFVRGNGQAVDVIVAETPYQDEAIRRAINGYLTVEDVIVHKLLAWRPRDQDDIRSIRIAGHDLDVAYVDRWAAEWEVTDRWAEAQAWPL